MFYHFKIHKDSDGFWAECIELQGCNTQGDTLEELRGNMEDVLNLYLSEPHSSKLIFPLPQKNINGRNIEKVKVDPSVAFSTILRMIRLKNKLTIRQMAKFLNYSNTNAYAKLEKPKSANPQLKTLSNIAEKFPDFPMNLIFSQEKGA